MTASVVPSDAVRCSDCHALYRSDACAGADKPVCPECGGVAWLAAHIPVLEPALEPERA